MPYEGIRETLNRFYLHTLPEMAKGTSERVFARMDAYDAAHPGENACRLKAKLYEAIADEVTPVVFADIPFFFETGALLAFSDGKFNRGGLIHANGWLYLRNEHIFRDTDPHAYEIYRQNGGAALYAQTGSFADIMHFGIPMKKIFRTGLRGVYRECLDALEECRTEEERDFIRCALAGLDALRTIELKFADAAEKQGMHSLADTARRIPWESPSTLHEGLCAMALIRKALGALEGVGFHSFGRADLLLEPLYKADRKRGISEEQMLDDVTRFLLIWDCTLPELLRQCRCNWEDERLRRKAVHAPSYGDGSEESSRLAGRLQQDLFRLSRGLPTAYGGEFRIGFNQYTEIIWWGKTTKATPNGRRDGEYLSQGLSPSRLARSGSVTDVLNSTRYMDLQKCAGNASMSVTLPAGKMDPDRLTAFFRAVSASGIPSIQPNCVNQEDLLRAQKAPEHYGHIIVRVCGFSAPFVLLSPTYQDEFLTRLTSDI